MEKKYFGTDGIRGVVSHPPLDDTTVYAIGAALGGTLQSSPQTPNVLIGMDTRESGPRIASLLAGGLRQAGAEVVFAGVITTPAVAYLTQQKPYAAGVMVSASHNHYQDNGIKVFGDTGFKLSDDVEEQIESEVEVHLAKDIEPHTLKLTLDDRGSDHYLSHLASLWKTKSTPYVLVDCANGAASELAPKLFEMLDVNAEFLSCSPDGQNINRDCGSLHMDELRRRVASSSADLGVAFDGDADRALFVAENGDLVDGDAVLLLAAKYLSQNNRLSQETVVTTVMANMGLEKSLQNFGISMVRTAVGDKYVLEEMKRLGAVLGGEQSGHIIFADAATTGDGLLTACRMLEIVAASGTSLSQLASQLVLFPQTLRNIKVEQKPALQKIPAIAQQITRSQQKLGDRGRIVVRYSGTEPLVRVMVEAEDPADVEYHASILAKLFEEHLGV
ncbi:MAG: phosphoglucosamine mutase [Solibacterales bacterium]|nr:phosphoglucosamine mutase [Bryobacterales bacterium]|tara:strand:+ start:808 stop:2145 length:1338 start_codon:yes stop_codon:yes gene_type:complete